MPDPYETWAPRFWDNASRGLGFTLVVYEAVNAQHSPEVLAVGVGLLVTPGVRQRAIRALLGGDATDGERGEWDDEPPEASA